MSPTWLKTLRGSPATSSLSRSESSSSSDSTHSNSVPLSSSQPKNPFRRRHSSSVASDNKENDAQLDNGPYDSSTSVWTPSAMKRTKSDGKQVFQKHHANARNYASPGKGDLLWCGHGHELMPCCFFLHLPRCRVFRSTRQLLLPL